MNILQVLKDILKKIDERQKNLIIMIVSVVLALFISNKYIHQNAAKKMIYYNSKIKQESEKNSLRENLQALDEKKASYEALIMHKSDVDKIKNKLAKMALASGINVRSISSQRGSNVGEYAVFSISLDIESTYHKLGKFIANLENAEPFIGVRHLKFAAITPRISRVLTREAHGRSDKKDTIVSASLRLETYLLRK